MIRYKTPSPLFRVLLAAIMFTVACRHAPAQVHTTVTVEDNQTITGQKTFLPGMSVGPILFANLTILPSQANGTTVYILDGSPTNPCSGGGTGAFAQRINGIWNCVLGGGAGIPGGINGQVQFNNAGAFGGITNVVAGSALVSGTPPAFQTKPIVDVRDYSGADWCAQVNAADTAFVGVNAIINVPSAMSGLTACTTSITLTSGHVLQFGAGTFNLGVLNGRGGILIGHAVNNVNVIGANRGVTTLNYTSFVVPLGSGGNAFPWGSAIGIGTVTACTGASDASNNIYVAGIKFNDLNTTTAMGSTHNPSAIDGACVNDFTVEYSQFNNIKGNAATTVRGSFGGGGGLNYRNQFNLFTGDVVGGWGEFAVDNSENWANYYFIGNNASGYKCGVGGSGQSKIIISDNIIDMTLVGDGTGCPAIGVGTADALEGHAIVSNNVIFLNSSAAVPGIAFSPKDATGNAEMAAIGNIIYTSAGAGTYGFQINGVGAGHNPPDFIIKDNYAQVTFPTAVISVLNNVELSGNDFVAPTSTNANLFSCNGANSIQSGGVVRVFNNRMSGYASNYVASNCSAGFLGSRQFQEWNNTLGDGSLNASAVAGASSFLGNAAKLTWTPGTISAGTSSATQTTTITGAIVGDEVKIIPDPATTLLPAGITITGYVSATNTVTWSIANNTNSPFTVNSGSPVSTYVSVDRPPLNPLTPALIGGGVVTSPASPTTSVQFNNSGNFGGDSNLTWDSTNHELFVGPVTTRTNPISGIPSVIIQEQAGFNPLEIHSNHQQGINMYTHDSTSPLRAPAIYFARSRGTQTSPTAVLNGDLLAVMNIGGYDGSIYGDISLISYGATENWNSTSHGMGAALAVVPNGTTSTTNAIVLGNTGAVTFPQTVTAPAYIANGVNGGISGTEGTGASVPPGAGLDVIWPDSTAHRWKMNNNNGGNQNVLGDGDWAVPGTIGSTTPNTGAFTTLNATGQITSTLSTGTAPFSITSTTPVANLTTVPTTYNHSGTQVTSAHIVQDRCVLGTSCSVTLTGSAVYTSSSTYDCTAADRTGANAIQFVPSSGSAFALTGTGTDSISYICAGD